MNRLTTQLPGWGLLGVLLLFGTTRMFAADSFIWNTNQNRVSAEIKSTQFTTVLAKVARATGWKVFLEPGAYDRISARFRDLPPGEALRLLLGNVSYALLPQTNGPARLYVFRTGMGKATDAVDAERGKVIPNELIVRVKPGTDVDELARSLGGRIKGKVDKLNAYKLEFDSAEAADAAREKLASRSEVASVENNYEIDRAPDLRGTGSVDAGRISMQLKPPPSTGRVVVGVIDTALQPMGSDLEKFIQTPVYIAGQPQLDPSSPSHGLSMVQTFLSSLEAATGGSTSVQVLPVDVYGANASTSTFDVAMGIIQAVNRGANVLNLSLGSDADSPILHDVIAAVAQKNIPIFAAAGNEPTTAPFYPAAYPEVMAVTALDHGQIASYANRGNFVSLWAPGTSVIQYNGQPWFVVGTSAASAYTAGVAAAYLENAGGNASGLQSFLSRTLGVGK
jgi:hypothetical protein